MRGFSSVALPALLLGACTGGNPIAYDGYSMPDFFPFDGNRTWNFQNDDASVPYRVVATLDPNYVETAAGARVFTISYTTTCPSGEDTDTEGGDCTEGAPWRIRSVKWSSDTILGTQIHEMDSDSTGDVLFDPPISITAGRGQLAAVETTETGGATWKSEFMEITDCPVLFTDSWNECVRIHLDDDGDEGTPGTHPLHGDYYAVAGWNVVAFQLTDDAALWELLSTEYHEIQ